MNMAVMYLPFKIQSLSSYMNLSFQDCTLLYGRIFFLSWSKKWLEIVVRKESRPPVENDQYLNKCLTFYDIKMQPICFKFNMFSEITKYYITCNTSLITNPFRKVSRAFKAFLRISYHGNDSGNLLCFIYVLVD